MNRELPDDENEAQAGTADGQRASLFGLGLAILCFAAGALWGLLEVWWFRVKTPFWKVKVWWKLRGL